MRYSVITVTYNDLCGLMETYKSLVFQCFDDYEWIVVDGGTVNGFQDFINGVEIRRLKWVCQKDGESYDAMNKGIAMAEGQYMIFMNSGDEFADSHVLNDVNVAIVQKKYRPQFIYGDSIEVLLNSQ